MAEHELDDVAEPDEKWFGVTDTCFEAGVEETLLWSER